MCSETLDFTGFPGYSVFCFFSFLRGRIPERLRWRIHRLWSVDWWDNSNKEFGKIIELLRVPIPCSDSLPPKVGLVTEGIICTDTKQKLASSVNKPQVVPSPSAPASRVKPYQPTVLPAQPMTPDEYLLPQKSGIIRKVLQMVLEQEAPISESLLTRRVVQSFGISRAGSKIQQRTTQILSSMQLTCTKHGGKNFYWLSSQNPDTYQGLRVSVSGIRDAGDIPVQEIANAVYATLEKQVAMPREDLLRETANLLGYSRLGNVVITSITSGIEYAVKTKKITEPKDDYYVLA